MRKFLGIALLLAGTGTARADDFEHGEVVVAFQPGTNHLFTAHDRIVDEWDATGTLVRAVAWPSQTIDHLACSPDGRLVATADERGQIVMWDVAQGKAAHAINPQAINSRRTALAFSPDGRVLATSVPLGVVLVDAATGRELRTIGTDSEPSDVQFSPDGKTIAVLAPGLRFYDTAGQEVAKFASVVKESAGRYGANAVGWTPDGQRVVAAGGHLVIAEPKTPHVLGEIDHGLGSYGHHVVVTNDGTWLGMSLDGDPGGIAWFSLPSLTLKATWKLPAVKAMAMSRDGKRIAVGLPDNTFQILDAGANKLTVIRTQKLVAPGAPAPQASSSPSAPTPAPAPPAGKPGSDKLLHDLGYAAVVILRENDRTEDRVRQEDAKACMAAVAAALAKFPDSAEVEVDATQPPLPGSRPYPQGGDVLVPIATVRDHVCKRGLAAGQAGDVSTKASAAAMWIGKLEHADTQKETSTSVIELAVKAGGECSKAVADAKQSGLAASTSVELFTYTSSLKSPMPLGEIDDKVCRVATAFGGKVIKERDAAEKAEYVPYLKVLAGDKAKLMWDKRMLGGDNWYGHGGRRLKSPADFAGSDVWYYYVVDRNGITPRWEVEGYVFSGSKKTGTYDVSGAGDTPPNSAFK